MKSHARDYVSYCECIFIDAFAKCSTDKASMIRDLVTLKSRITHEGLSFLTLTLPMFGQEFEKALDCAEVTPKAFSGWKKRLSLPAFLQGLTGLVFDARTGGLLEDPNIAAIEGIRQIAYTFKKLSLPCTPERESMALFGFQEVERTLSETVFSGDIDLFIKINDLLWGNVFNEDFDPQRYIPKHGPGQTAERISGNRKYIQRNWYERLEPFFPSDIYLMSCVEQLSDKTDGIDCVQFASPEQELPVRITLVPKTLKGPRIIAMEPVCMQYAQQALAGPIIDRLETFYITAGHINFHDQSVNRKLALSTSKDELMATLDLSSASDRVPLSLVSLMLQSRPDVRDAILACRSKVAQLPSGELITLKKFASMGSALCFPIESMYFFSVILLALFQKHKLPVTLRNIHRLSRSVYVYGDDIIIPVDEVEDVTKTLTSFYCKVNTAKSFWNGKFRESCGMDAYDGECVTPTYLRQEQPGDMGQAKRIISWVETSNLFYRRGYWRTAAYMKDRVEAVTGELPVILETSPGLGWVTFQRGHHFHRWSKSLHRYEIRTLVPSPVYRKDPLGGWSALLKYFITTEGRQGFKTSSPLPIDKEHLSRSPRSGTSSIKRRWTTPY